MMNWSWIRWATRKTALFLIMSDTDDSFNFLIAMCYTQFFNLLCERRMMCMAGGCPFMCVV